MHVHDDATGTVLINFFFPSQDFSLRYRSQQPGRCCNSEELVGAPQGFGITVTGSKRPQLVTHSPQHNSSTFDILLVFAMVRCLCFEVSSFNGVFNRDCF